tara:strand:+ start:42 stop:764 length:723 start_codon:yes stop_codon:yes gene_type:complete
MATTIAQISLSSSDLLTNVLALSDTSTLTIAGDVTGLTQTSGLGRTTTSAAAAGNIQAEILYRGDDALTNGANKVYLKNTSANAAHYFTIHIDGEELGRLYAGDWAFFPWSATAGTKASFTLTIAGAWVAGDTWEFDGVTATATNATESDFCAIIDGTNYPNWTTDHNAAGAEETVAFTARQSGGLTQSTAVTADGTKSSSSGTSVISSGAAGTGKSESDISIRPSVHTGMTMEHILFHE